MIFGTKIFFYRRLILKVLMPFLGSCSMLFALGACHGHHDEEVVEKKINISDLPVDFKAPSMVWKMIVKPEAGKEKKGEGEKKPEKEGAKKQAEKKEGAEEHKTEAEGEKAKEGEGASVISEEKSIVFSSVDIVLKEKTPDVLVAPLLRIQFPRGGGTLDLSQYTTGKVGSFFISFDFSEIQKHGTEKVLFWSRAKKRKIEDEVFGAGCNKIIELGKKWKSLQQAGLKVNTLRNRHLSVLGGRYFITSQTEKEIFLAQVYIHDSKNQDLLCSESRTEKSRSAEAESESL